MKQLIDISIPMKAGMIHWPGDIPFTRIQRTEIGINDAVSNDSILIMSAHCGTHVDAPRHFIRGGKTADKLSLSTTIGPVYVLDCSDCDGQIGEEVLRRVPENTLRLLIKTKNGGMIRESFFNPDFIGLNVSGAAWIKDHGILLFGSDYCSIGALADGSIAQVHQIFLSNENAVVLEGLDLSKVEEGEYELICLPLSIEGSDGAPCRAVLIKEDTQ